MHFSSLAWNKKWGQTLSKELEYGTVLQSLLGGLAESNDIADIHLAVQGKLSEVSSQLLQWKSETYHKGIIGIKESKKAEEGFSKGQKPWAKKFDDCKYFRYLILRKMPSEGASLCSNN